MTGGGEAATFLYLLLCMILVASALSVRRIPIGQGAKMAAVWLLIFATVFIAFTLKDDFRALANRIWSRSGDTVVQGDSVRIRQQSDGHYWVDGSINGTDVRLLVDSGATSTVIGRELAASAGIELDSGFPVALNTANGTIFARRATAPILKVGSITRTNFPILVADGESDFNVLGMNFLSSLRGWSVEDGWLVLRP